ncbi:MAG: ATP/GTP-binding protein [Acidimicrobiales bacterium]|nr:ATP/GTP-binding protein [Acidimicrobiales bacterium]
MPKRNRRRQPAPKSNKPKAGHKSTGRPKVKGRRTLADPSDAPDTEIHFVSAADASKDYLCPGCGREISVGQGHLVAVPASAPDLRRHWHRGCWERRMRQ